MLRRATTTLLRACSLLCALMALVTIFAWTLGSALSDRFYWSQFLAWIPTALDLAVAGALVALAGVLAILSRRTRRGRSWLIRIAAVLLAIQLPWFALVECRVYRLPHRRPLAAAAANPGGLRVLFWNATSTPGADLRTTMNLVPSDLAITANPSWDRPFTEMAQAFGPASYLSAGEFVVLSRSPILRFGAASLGLDGRNQVSVGPGEFEILPRGHRDTGRALWMQIDTRAVLGRTIVVWVLDMPSDERTGRWRNAALAARVMRDWPGPAIIPDGRGGVLGTEAATGFPAPDLVLGDLNSPRGSVSLALLAPGLDELYAQGGAGYAATFPRRHPVVHIDLMLAAPWLRGDDYRVIDPGRGTHRMQWARLNAR